MTKERRGGLLGEHDFRHLWTADLASQLGSRLSMMALPLLAVITLHASTFQAAALSAAQTAASLLLGLFAGALVDRMRCRPVLIAADLARFALLGSIPVAALFGVLGLPQLYAVAFAAGVGTVFFDTAHTTYLPRLIGRGQLVEGNSRLASNSSIAAVAGSVGGGYLVQLCTAPVAIAVDAVSYLWSAVWLGTIRTGEPRPARPARPRLLHEIGEGVRFVAGQPILAAIAGNTATVLFFQAANQAIMVVFLVREVHLTPGAIGLLGTVGLLGALASAALTGRIARRLGSARALCASTVLNGVGFLLYPLTGPGLGLVWYVLAGGLTAFTIITRHVMAVTARQQLCPDRLLGRVNATMELTTYGVMPLGALAGGLLGTLLGLRTTLVVSGCAILAASLFLVLSPVRRLRDLPAADHPDSAPAAADRSVAAGTGPAQVGGERVAE
ncbi:MFS transporter [Actinocatenispora thailandica]|uniref:MFS transporter n=1 Tax=Actinocatenispora thailandica TaxID=227318 RepID=A0A7R7DQ74_9ACTN|nr:MFS transporter [Actinocatenispora thailandica]